MSERKKAHPSGKRKGKGTEPARRLSSLPPMGSLPCIELSGNREAVLEGSKGVLEYSPALVRVNTGGMVVSICGRGLDLRCISPSALIVGGTITKIELTS